eukprot:CAMPEP_0197025980 /NCGR_PEP_ID=MMETSP1384-20130603/6176_1 /TAXON_ID=29189 /ORGANISM="Ammonia sp." /LENGTH=215 /DNA_ID=CAMNT_0042454579 /DNA_START=26 /DNA_END=673 /DNA_ORIENTATION=+
MGSKPVKLPWWAGCLLLLIGIAGFVLFGLGLVNYAKYSTFKDAMFATCRYDSSVARNCSGHDQCSGLVSSHLYAIRNDSAAFAECNATLILWSLDEEDCACDRSSFTLEEADNSNTEWHDCWLNHCRQTKHDDMDHTVSFEEPTKKAVGDGGIAMLVLGLLIMIGACMTPIYFKKLRKYQNNRHENRNSNANEANAGDQDAGTVPFQQITANSSL